MQLKARQQMRREAVRPSVSHRAPSYEDRKVVMDDKASKRNRGPAARRMPARNALIAHTLRLEREEEEEERLRAEEAEGESGDVGGSSAKSENYQTKPNIEDDPEVLLRHQRLMETADRVLKLGDSLAPKPRPSGE